MNDRRDALDEPTGEFDPTVPRTGRSSRSGRTTRQSSADHAPTIPNPRRPSRANSQRQRHTQPATRPHDGPLSAPQRPVTILEIPPASMTEGFARYRLGEELGRGGMGLVRHAIDPAFRRELAVKTLLESRDAQAITQFIDEAQITGQLEHPNIVPVHELGRDPQGRPYLTMKLVQGRTLREVIREAEISRRAWRHDEPEFLAIFRKICEAIAYAHSRGVIHRDLKPENIMIGEFGEVLVMDWGLAKPLDNTGHDARGRRAPIATDRRTNAAKSDLTVDGEVFGTPAYMAPEQARGDVDAIDERADIFALGAMLYSLLTCRAPYAGKTAVQILAHARAGEFPQADRIAPWRGVPKELAAIAAKAMAFEPANRYATAHDLLADVAAYQRFAPITARRDSPLSALVKWLRRHPRMALGGAMGVVFSLVVGGLIVQLQAAQRETEFAQQSAELADARAAREAADAAAAKALAAQSETDARLAQIAEAAALNQLDVVRQLTNAEAKLQRDAALDEFGKLWDEKQRRHISDLRFAKEVGEFELRRFLAAFDRLIDDVAPTTGMQVGVGDYFYRGFLRNFAEDWQGAIADFDRVIARAPKFAVAYINRGNARKALGRYVEAIADFDAALALDPQNAEALCNRGLAKDMQGDFAGAIADFERAIDLAPNLAEAYNNRGNVYRRQGKFALAMADFDRAIELFPTFAEALSNRGMTRDAQGDKAGAMTDYDRAIAIDRSFAVAYNNRGNLKHAQGDLSGAIADFDSAIANAPTLAEAFCNRGSARNSQGDYKKAIEDFDRAIALAPKLAAARINRAIARMTTRDFAGAIADCEIVIDLDGRMWQGFAVRGQCRVAGNIDREAGIADLQQAYRLCTAPAEKAAVAAALRQAGGTVPE